MAKTTEQLRKELKNAEAREAAEFEAKRRATPPIRKYMIELMEISNNSSFDYVYDDSCLLYRIHSFVTNKEAAEAAGWSSSWDLNAGGMTYVYNTLSKKLVMGTGGGNIYIGPSWNKSDDTSHIRAMEEINAFLQQHPEGGDITDIVMRHRQGDSYVPDE